MTLVLLDNDTTQVVRRVPQGEPRREAVLRDLITEHPALLPIHDLDPSYGRLVTVTRELSIPGVGFVDVLLIDEAGRLVMVECKLWRNPQARREVVGQILDYARELSRYGYEDLQRQDAYLEAVDSATSSARRDELRRGLLDYCALDTMAMVVVLERLCR